MQRVYISSTISGDEESAGERFGRAKQFVESKGYVVINPYKDNEKSDWLECLIRDVKNIKYNVTLVYFFGKWYRSAGCWMEFLVAIRHNKVCWFEDKFTHWMFKGLQEFLTWLWRIKKLDNK